MANHELIDSTFKSFPGNSGSMPVEDIKKQKWNLLNGDIPLPAAVILNSALHNNAQWMQEFLKHTEISFAPHGKTTLSPQLIRQQLEEGAWGITVANYQQLYLCWKMGVGTILMANQIIDRASLRSVLNILQKDPELKFYCLIDSIEGCKRLNEEAKNFSLTKPISVLIELGVMGGRTGCRSVEEGLKLAKQIASLPSLQLAGIESYEGIIVTNDSAEDVKQVKHLLNDSVRLAKECDAAGYFKSTREILLTAGGSGYFDLVAECFESASFSKPKRIVIRSGCYLTHDAKFYNHLFDYIMQRLEKKWPITNQLKPALEIWSVVQSRPEPTLAILSFGKRDASYDINLPIPVRWFSIDTQSKPQAVGEDWQIFRLNDQHAYCRIPAQSEVKVGDLVGCGISHPCTTFDKWKLLYIVDDNYTVIDAIRTFF